MADVIQETHLKEKFMSRILQIDKHEKKEDHYNVMTKEGYEKLMDEIEEAQLAQKKTPKQYRRLNRFKVVKICGARKLVTKKKPMRFYLYIDEIFDTIATAHLAAGHGGRDRLRKETSKTFANITTEMIKIFLSMCEICQIKKSMKKRSLEAKPKISEMNSRSQVELIDMQTKEDRGFRFILVYQDYSTRFVLLRALRTDSILEVAEQLTDIFLTFGAPCVLQSNHSKTFINSVIDKVMVLWPECKLVFGKPRSSKAVEQTSQDILKKLSTWMQKNKTSNWSNGLGFVQFERNRAVHSGNKLSPYKAMFGKEPRPGLPTLRLPSDVKKELQDAELEKKINSDNLIRNEMKVEISSSEIDSNSP